MAMLLMLMLMLMLMLIMYLVDGHVQREQVAVKDQGVQFRPRCHQLLHNL